MTKAPIDLESHFRWNGDAFADGQLVDTVTPRTGNNKDNDPLKRREPVWGEESHPGSWRAVWAYSAKRFAHDNKTLNKQEERAHAVVAGEKTVKGTRFVKTKGANRFVDIKTLARARQLAGLKGYVTNIPVEIMPPIEVINHYHDLWQVEKSFRMSKSDLAARPIFARSRDAIEAHLTIVFAALAVSREIQNRTGKSIRRIIRTLKPLRSAILQVNGTKQVAQPQIDPETQNLINLLTTTRPRH